MTTILLTGLIICLITFSHCAKQGALNGISLCENIIIPSLLPILILSNTLIKSKSKIVFQKLFGKIFEKFFHLPKNSAIAVIFGLIAGYPAGAILTNELYNEHLINSSQAKRIMSFNFCGGAAFIITAVGTITLKSTKLGLILYLTNVLSSLIVCIISRFFDKSELINSNQFSYQSFNNALANGTQTAINSILNICAYIILFSAIMDIFAIPSYLLPIVEITNGICATSLNIPLEYYAFFLSFGGICIHFQLISIINSFNMQYFDFFIYRLLNALLSFVLMKGYLLLYPQQKDVFSNLSSVTIEATQVNFGFGIIMVLGCAVIILDVEGRKYKLR